MLRLIIVLGEVLVLPHELCEWLAFFIFILLYFALCCFVLIFVYFSYTLPPLINRTSIVHAKFIIFLHVTRFITLSAMVLFIAYSSC